MLQMYITRCQEILFMITNSCGKATKAPRYLAKPHLHRIRVNYNVIWTMSDLSYNCLLV